MVDVDESTTAIVVTSLPTKRKRVVTNKPTRNGCKTCRLRRVKCDETRPACTKCISSGRKCEGFAALPRGNTVRARPLLPASRSPSENTDDTSSTVSVLTTRSSPTYARALTPVSPPRTLHFSITDAERNAFDFFCLRMAGPLEIMSPAKGWVQQALQVSLGSEVVFHAIAALSSANMAMASISHPTFAGVPKPEGAMESLNQYGRTVTALRRQIREVVEGHAPLEPILLTCLLLMCYEFHSERSSMAIRHHAMGRKILAKHLSDERSGSASPAPSSNSLQLLAEGFEKLNVGASNPLHDSGLVNTRSIDQQPALSMHVPSASFLSESWSELDHLIDSANQVLDQLFKVTEQRVTEAQDIALDQATRYCLVSCLSRSINLPARSTILPEIQCLLDKLDQWAAKVSSYIQHPHYKPSRALSLLQIRHWQSSYTLATCRSTTEKATDYFELDFIRVCDLAQQYLDHPSVVSRPRPRSPYGNGQDDVFSLEDGIINALHLVSLKSRASATRHRAIDILANAYRRECLGSSTITAQIAVATVRLEEDRAKAMLHAPHSDLRNHQVPEMARFADVVHAPGGDLQRPSCRLICARYLHESDGCVEVSEYYSKGPCFPYSKCAGKCSMGFQFVEVREKVRYEAPSTG